MGEEQCGKKTRAHSQCLIARQCYEQIKKINQKFSERKGGPQSVLWFHLSCIDIIIHSFTKQWALTVYESLISWFIALIYFTLVRFTFKWNLWLSYVDVILYWEYRQNECNIIIVFIYEAIRVGVIASGFHISAYKVIELIFYQLAVSPVS